jgi:hypothetical protein
MGRGDRETCTHPKEFPWTFWPEIVVRGDRLLGANKFVLHLRQDLQGEIIPEKAYAGP